MQRNLKMPGKSPGCLIGLLIAGGLVVLLLSGGLGKLFGGRNDVPVTGGVPGSGFPSGNQGAQGDLGPIFVANQVTNNGCPANRASEFYPNETIFVGLEESDLPRGTSVFARLYQDGQPIEDTNQVVADQAINNTCVWFAFEPRGGNFDPGQYTAEIIINGRAAGSQALVVGGSSGQGGILSAPSAPGAGSQVDAQLGTMYTSSGVTQEGCPVDDVQSFYSDEPVYVALDESFIPAGSEVFARLLYEGQPVEDTQPVYAERDTRACVWFAFEPRGQGFDRGNYQAQIFLDGRMADRLDFVVE